MSTLGRRTSGAWCNGPGLNPQFAQSCQLLQDAEGSQSCYNIGGGGGGGGGQVVRRRGRGGARRAKLGSDPQLASVLAEPTYGEEEGSPKQQWPPHNGLLMGGSSGMDCIRAAGSII